MHPGAPDDIRSDLGLVRHPSKEVQNSVSQSGPRLRLCFPLLRGPLSTGRCVHSHRPWDVFEGEPESESHPHVLVFYKRNALVEDAHRLERLPGDEHRRNVDDRRLEEARENPPGRTLRRRNDPPTAVTARLDELAVPDLHSLSPL